MLFTTKWLATIFNKHQGNVDDDIVIDEVITDSRSKMGEALFIPLVGDLFDGHDYLKQAFDNGAVATIWNANKQLPAFLPKDFPVYFVKDTLTGLHDLAMRYRNEINPIVIGITGSNGKTTTKDLVSSIVKTTYRTHFTHGNFNNHIGLPLTILGMARETEVLVLEMGMNDFQEIEQLSKIARPDYAVITNIGESHIEFLGSREGIAKAKLEIVNGMDKEATLIMDGDEKLLEPVYQRANVVTCGFHSENDLVIDQVEIAHDKTTFNLGDMSYAIPLLGKHHAQNATYAIILGRSLKITDESIKKGLLFPELTSMRFELLKGKNGVSIINDAFNASPTSMKAAIDVVKEMKGFRKKILILGDIFELGNQSEILHASVSEKIEAPITALYTYGSAAKTITDVVKQKNTSVICIHFESKELLLQELKADLNKENVLLFKASRGMEFESLVNALI